MTEVYMKTYLTIFGIACLTVACATPSIERETVGFSFKSDERLSHYVTEFLADCRMYLPETVCFPSIELHVTVNQLPDNILGQCMVYQSKLRTIQLDETVLNQYNERAVMYHELFHCITNKPHFDDELDIMNTYEMDVYTLRMYDNWSFYVGKVFTRE